MKNFVEHTVLNPKFYAYLIFCSLHSALTVLWLHTKNVQIQKADLLQQQQQLIQFVLKTGTNPLSIQQKKLVLKEPTQVVQ